MNKLVTLLFAGAVAMAMTASCQAPQGAPAAADPAIAAAVAQVNIDSVKVYIDELVSLHTRHTLSSQTDPEKGLGAAIAYLAGRCERWAQQAASGRPRPLIERVF